MQADDGFEEGCWIGRYDAFGSMSVDFTGFVQEGACNVQYFHRIIQGGQPFYGDVVARTQRDLLLAQEGRLTYEVFAESYCDEQYVIYICFFRGCEKVFFPIGGCVLIIEDHGRRFVFIFLISVGKTSHGCAPHIRESEEEIRGFLFRKIDGFEG